jgi:hypothetical protein
MARPVLSSMRGIGGMMMNRHQTIRGRLAALLGMVSLGASSLLLLGAGCQDRVVSPGSPQGRNLIVTEGSDATLATGERLHFDRVVADSRCPQGVLCIWAGEAEASFSLQANGRVVTPFTLGISGGLVAADTVQSMQAFRPVTVGRYRMTLLQLDPYPKEGRDPLTVTSTALIRVEYVEY